MLASCRLAHDLTVATSKDKIIWECENGGQLWGESAVAGYANQSSFPNAICGPGWQSLFTAFIVSLLVDLGFQVRKKSLLPNGRAVDIPHFPILRVTWAVIEVVRFLPQLALQETDRKVHHHSEQVS